jgi:hypothetical protein
MSTGNFIPQAIDIVKQVCSSRPVRHALTLSFLAWTATHVRTNTSGLSIDRKIDSRLDGLADYHIYMCLFIPIPLQHNATRQAIDADQKGEYETALNLYKKSLDYFMAVRFSVCVGWDLLFWQHTYSHGGS